MDSSHGSLKIEKLRNNNFHTCNHRVELVLALRELDKYLDDTPTPSVDSRNYGNWIKCDRKAKAIIGLTLSDDHLEQVQHASSSLSMWNLIYYIFEKNTLPNTLSDRRKFYTASMSVSENVL